MDVSRAPQNVGAAGGRRFLRGLEPLVRAPHGSRAACGLLIRRGAGHGEPQRLVVQQLSRADKEPKAEGRLDALQISSSFMRHLEGTPPQACLCLLVAERIEGATGLSSVKLIRNHVTLS